MKVKIPKEEVLDLIQILDDFAFDCEVCGYFYWSETALRIKGRLEKALNYSIASSNHFKYKNLQRKHTETR
ncbi:MAG: hypothetical protein ACTSUO_06020 [Candidatus Thorarchaeota archaeon]